MVVFAALSLVGLHALGVPAFLALAICILIMLALAVAVERLVLRPLVNQPDIILFMATIGLTYFLIGFGELVFGGEPKVMIAQELLLPTGLLRVGDAGRPGDLPADRHRRRRDRGAHGRGPRLLLPVHADRPGPARRRRRPPGGPLGRHLARDRSGSSSGSRPASWRSPPASCGVPAPTSASRCRSWR